MWLSYFTVPFSFSSKFSNNGAILAELKPLDAGARNLVTLLSQFAMLRIHTPIRAVLSDFTSNLL